MMGEGTAEILFISTSESPYWWRFLSPHHVAVRYDGHYYSFGRDSYSVSQLPPNGLVLKTIAVPSDYIEADLRLFSMDPEVRYIYLSVILAAIFPRHFDNCVSCWRNLVGKSCRTPRQMMKHLERKR